MTPPDPESQAATPPVESNGAVPVSASQTNPAEIAQFGRQLLIAVAIYAGFSLFIGLPFHIDFQRLSTIAMPLVFLLAFGPTLVFMALQLWVLLATVRLPRPAWEIVAALIMGALWGLSVYLDVSHPHVSRFTSVIRFTVSAVLETVGFGLAGAFAARIIKEPKLLLPIGFIAGLIDIIGAMTPIGFTANAIAKHPSLVNHVSVHVPSVAGLPAPATIGPGDVFFIAFFFAIVSRHKMNVRLTFWMFYLLLTMSLLAVQFTHVGAIGALAPMGIAVIISNVKFFDYSREEKFAMLYAGTLAIALTLGFFVYTNSLFHRHRHHRPGVNLPAQNGPNPRQQDATGSTANPSHS